MQLKSAYIRKDNQDEVGCSCKINYILAAASEMTMYSIHVKKDAKFNLKARIFKKIIKMR